MTILPEKAWGGKRVFRAPRAKIDKSHVFPFGMLSAMLLFWNLFRNAVAWRLENSRMDKNCLFCKIGAGDIPSVKIYESDGVLAFLDISPVEKGHTLVLSKRVHSPTLLDTPPDVLAEVLSVVRKVGAAMMQVGFGGFNVVQNNFLDAGQTVPHLHFHVIPRTKGRTAPLDWESGAHPYADDADRDAIAAKIRAALAE